VNEWVSKGIRVSKCYGYDVHPHRYLSDLNIYIHRCYDPFREYPCVFFFSLEHLICYTTWPCTEHFSCTSLLMYLNFSLHVSISSKVGPMSRHTHTHKVLFGCLGFFFSPSFLVSLLGKFLLLFSFLFSFSFSSFSVRPHQYIHLYTLNAKAKANNKPSPLFPRTTLLFWCVRVFSLNATHVYNFLLYHIMFFEWEFLFPPLFFEKLIHIIDSPAVINMLL